MKMSPRKIFLVTVIIAASGSAFPAMATLITELKGLDVDGTSYDVTFHQNVSFLELWDSNNDGIFGNDTSLFNAAPEFWNDQTAAISATLAAIEALTDVDYVHFFSGFGPTDRFFVPYERNSSDPNKIDSIVDMDPDLVDDASLQIANVGADSTAGATVWASFERSTTVTAPATLALMTLGIAGLGFSRRKAN